MLVLSVNINQTGGQLPDQGLIDRLPVDPADAPAVLVFPGDDHLALLHGNIHLFQPFQCLPVFCDEDQFHQSVVRPLWHIILKAAGAQRHIQGADQNRFARSRLARHNIQSGAEGNLLLLNQRHIFYMQTY